MKSVRGYLQDLINFIFPPSCPLCNARVETHGELCGDCWTAFNWIDGTKCIKCGFPFASSFDLSPNMMCPTCAAGKCELDLIRSACVYDDASRAAMLPYKHAGHIQYARFMARAMIWALRDVDIAPDIVMPVPLASRRLFQRGYNQATLLARPIARAFHVPMDLDSVSRKYRENMGHKTSSQRAQNVHNVFTVRSPDKIRGKKILLVDDVMTTGATFNELRRVLVDAGAVAVYGVTFCRVARSS
ncbi:MAG: ComF family protein [Alphaproteobacteria bacterium]|nr:ComF family protein [Alphaproteobacteria bacterium]